MMGTERVSPPSGATEAIESSITELSAGLERWRRTDITERVRLLDRLSEDTLAAAPGMVRASCKGKGIDPESTTASEEWLGGPATVLRHIRLLRETLAGIARTSRPPVDPSRVSEQDGTAVVPVFPAGLQDRLTLTGFSAEVVMESGVGAEETVATAARAYLAPDELGHGICAVLGAGNVSGIGLQDVLTKLFQENRACALKLNPINDYLEESYRQAFSALVEVGVLRILRGDATEGAALVHHPEVTEVHITGSSAVHDAIVWGGPDVREKNRAAGTPVLAKPISSELGCVTPVMVVPGRWSAREMRFQAWNVASMLTNNASFNCNAAKVLVTARGWEQRDAFLEELRSTLSQVPTRNAYYPGAQERHAGFVEAHPGTVCVGAPPAGHLPWALATGLDPERRDDPAFTTEAWCGVLAETALPAETAAEFLGAAVPFANEVLFGTLSCTLIAQPASVADPASAHALDSAIADLRYGTVALNHWAAIGYGLGITPWGAYPGHSLEDIGSGIGTVHNTPMFARPAKGVVRGPFAPGVKPLWAANHRRAHRAARALAHFEARPGIGTLASLASHALRG